MQVDRKVWDFNLIQDLVGNINEASGKISQTPLIESIQEDKINWKYEKNGHYLVKSVYRFFYRRDSGYKSFSSRWKLESHLARQKLIISDDVFVEIVYLLESDSKTVE